MPVRSGDALTNHGMEMAHMARNISESQGHVHGTLTKQAHEAAPELAKVKGVDQKVKLFAKTLQEKAQAKHDTHVTGVHADAMTTIGMEIPLNAVSHPVYLHFEAAHLPMSIPPEIRRQAIEVQEVAIYMMHHGEAAIALGYVLSFLEFLQSYKRLFPESSSDR